MTAAEARELSNKGGTLNQDKLQGVYKSIKDAASTGKTTVNIQHETSMNAIVIHLRKDGYTCEKVPDSRDGDYWTISW